MQPMDRLPSFVDASNGQQFNWTAPPRREICFVTGGDCNFFRMFWIKRVPNLYKASRPTTVRVIARQHCCFREGNRSFADRKGAISRHPFKVCCKYRREEEGKWNSLLVRRLFYRPQRRAGATPAPTTDAQRRLHETEWWNGIHANRFRWCLLTGRSRQCIKKKLLTTNTHRGLFNFNRLAIGVKSAPGIFQQMMGSMLAGLDGCAAYFVGVIIRYLGNTIDADEGHPDPAKQRSSKKMPPPKDIG
ncbi:hypothetical protein TELCIR_00971 [Teladorsagia circumcincta]|uniref:Uncharacterized protein n=1 Tax=Teladorsagia circumcincta TaxID=45464 RepID=A0A2G9V389_TELCI|nr:hypothetical protein TELCIR_00971 [Teladorsagia circumcincta]